MRTRRLIDYRLHTRIGACVLSYAALRACIASFASGWAHRSGCNSSASRRNALSSSRLFTVLSSLTPLRRLMPRAAKGFDSACWSTWTAAAGSVSIISATNAMSSAETTGGSVLPASVLASCSALRAARWSPCLNALRAASSAATPRCCALIARVCGADEGRCCGCACLRPAAAPAVAPARRAEAARRASRAERS